MSRHHVTFEIREAAKAGRWTDGGLSMKGALYRASVCYHG